MKKAFFWVVLWMVFLVKGVWLLDPDLGWHLRMGETIVKSGIPLTDPFSYTMPTFAAVGNEWLNNVVEYLIYGRWGKAGLAVVWASMAVAAIALVLPGKARNWAVVPILLALGTLVGLGGVRAQVIDWLMLAATMRLWENGKRWMLPALFGLWANAHGAFGLGPVVLGILMAAKVWRNKKIDVGDAGVWILGVVATLVNPWGVRLWGEVWAAISDGSLKWTVAEWRPFWATTPWIGVAMLAAGAGMTWWKFGSREMAGQVAAAAIVGIMAVGGVRHTGLFALAAVPVMAEGLRGFKDKVRNEVEDRWEKFYKLLVVMAVLVAGVETAVGLTAAWGLREEKFYPKAAISWLKTNPGKGRVFTDYGWGGYVLWKMPEEKVFIDGRMATWKGGVFSTYLMIVGRKEDFAPVFDKYGVDTVLWPKRTIEEPKIVWGIKWGKEKEEFPLALELEKRGWVRIYEDDVSLIYRRI